MESGSETAKSLLSAVGGVVAKAAEKLSHAMLNMGDTVNVEVRGQHTHKREEYIILTDREGPAAAIMGARWSCCDDMALCHDCLALGSHVLRPPKGVVQILLIPPFDPC